MNGLLCSCHTSVTCVENDLAFEKQAFSTASRKRFTCDSSNGKCAKKKPWRALFKKNINLIYKEILNMIIRGQCSVRQFSMQSCGNRSLKTIKLENCSISEHEGCGIFAFKSIIDGHFLPLQYYMYGIIILATWMSFNV